MVDVAGIQQRPHIRHVYHVPVHDAEHRIAARRYIALWDDLRAGPIRRADLVLRRGGRQAAPGIELAGREHGVGWVDQPAAVLVRLRDVGGRR